MATIVLCHQKVQFMYSANLLFGKRALLWTLFFLCFIGLSGATSAFVGATPAGNVAETPTSEPPKHSQDEQNWSAVFESSRPLGQDWRQYAARDALKPELQTPARIVLESVKAPLTEGRTTILLLTLQANNIQVRAVWKVTNALTAFAIDNGKLSLTAAPNETATFVATVYLIDNFQVLNTAYQNLTASAVITVEVKTLVESLSLAQPPRLEVTAGIAEEVYVFVASGGIMPHTYTLLHNPDDDAFHFTNGTLSVNISATIGEYRFTVAVTDDATMAVTVTATVEVAAAALAVAQPPRLEVTAGIAEEVYVFVASGGIMPHTYTLLHNPDDGAFAFSNGTLAVNISAIVGEYRFTIAVADAASMTVTVAATVEVVAALAVAQPPRLEATKGIAKEVYVFEASGGIMPHTYALLHNPDNNAFYFTNGTLSVNADATIGEYRFTVAVADAAGVTVTVAATVEIKGRQIFVLGGQYGNKVLNDVWSSADGANWVDATLTAGWAGRYFHQALSHHGRLYVLGGYDGSRLNDVWSSADGRNWARETDDAKWAGRYSHQALSHNGRLYVLGGVDKDDNFLNDVWSSADGQNWERETANAKWTRRYGHQALSHNGRLYVLGGIDDSFNRRNDVWSSADGQNWSREASNAEWTRRDRHQALSHNGRLYVLGGYGGGFNNDVNDVWSSADGKNWELITISADWTEREGHQAVVFPPELVLWGVAERLTVSAGIAANLHTFTAQYGRGDYSYSLTPAVNGFAVSPGGVLSAQSDAALGEHTLTVWVKDDADNRAQTAVKVFVAHFHLAEVPLLSGFAGIAKILHTITADGGIPGEQYMIVAGNNQGYFALDADSGVLSLLTTAWEGVYTLSVEVSDSSSLSRKATAAATVEIKDRQIFVLGGISNGNLNDVWFSADGQNWSLETNDAGWDERWLHQALSHHGRLYVLGGYDVSNRYNDVWSSADGKNWSRETDNAGWTRRYRHQALSHHGRLYVLGGYDGSNCLNDVWSSADGKNWARETSNAEWAGRVAHQALSHHGRLYVLGGEDGSNRLNDVWSSADGKNWVEEASNAEWDERWSPQALSHHGRLYVLGGEDDSNNLNDVWSSADGQNWARETDNAEWAGRYDHQALSHHGRLYVLGGFDDSNRLNDVWSSADGQNWALITLSADWSAREGHQAVVFPPELVLWGVAERLTVSAGIAANLHTFTSQYGRGDYSYSLTPAVNGFAVSPGGVLSAQSDAALGEHTLTVWVKDDADNRAQTAVKVFVAHLHLAEVPLLSGFAGIAKVLHTITADGGIPGEQYMIVAGNNQGYFALDADSGVLSLLTTAWEGVYTLSVEVSDSSSLSHKATAVATVEIKGRQIFVLGGNVGSNLLNDVWSSADGQNWARETANAEWTGRSGHQAVSHNGRLYVLGGIDGSRLNDVWSSADGQNWARETANAEWAARYGHQALSHNGRLYVLGGFGSYENGSYYKNDVWSSADGQNWSLETDNAEWAGRWAHQALSHNGRLYVLGGWDGSNRRNDVWSSADGQNWARETDNAEWAARYGHQALSHNGRLYVLGGFGSYENGSYYKNDVWSSADGQNWSRETDNAEWTGREYHQALSHNGRLYVLGGSDNSRRNDVWSSADGEEWELITLSADWSAREGHQAVVFPPELVLWGVAERLAITEGIAKDLHTFTAQYGRGDYSYSLTPAVNGFALSPDGVLSAQSDVAGGEYTLTVWVKDDADKMAQTAIRVLVNDLHLAEVPLLFGFAGIAKVLHTITTGGVTPGEQYMIVAGNSQGYFALDADSGVLSLLTTAWEGVYTLSVEVSDSSSLSHKATAVATVEIKGRQIFVLGGYAGKSLNDVWFSANGQNWVAATLTAEWVGRSLHQALSHNSRLYVLGGVGGGNLNDVWSSADGQNWALETANAEWTGREYHQALSHHGRLYVLGGYGDGGSLLNDVWSSADGQNWARETSNAEWAGRYGHQALSHNGRLYVLGGSDGSNRLNDVWSSADGKNWVEEASNAEWDERWSPQALSHHGRLYVLGGEDDSNNLNDVWSSVAGKNWVREPDNAKWTGRHKHQALSHHGRLYVLGGYDGSNHLNDVWSWADGEEWELITISADWTERNGHQAVVFPPELVLWGVAERLTVSAGIAADLHTFTAQYGRGDYSYSLSPAVNGFAVSPGGVLSAESDATVGEYTLTVWVEDGERNRAQTALRVTVVAQSTAQSHPFSPIISPSRSPIISPSASRGVQVP